MGRHGSTMHKQRGSWKQGLPGRGSLSCLMMLTLLLLYCLSIESVNELFIFFVAMQLLKIAVINELI